MRMNAASDSGDELMRQSASLLMSNQTRHLMSGKTRAENGNDFIDPLAFVFPHLSIRSALSWLQGGGRFPREGPDFPENLLEGLPATVCRTPVVPIYPDPIDVGIAG
jgi:hypothetical protein